MKVLVDSWEMGGFPWLLPYREGEHDARRAIDVPEDLYERLVDSHEEFCAVLAEVDVECVEIMDAPFPSAPRLEYGRHYPEGNRYSGGTAVEGYAGRCRSCGAEVVAESAVPFDAGEEARALGAILARGWRERRHGGLSCPACAPTEILLPEKEVGV